MSLYGIIARINLHAMKEERKITRHYPNMSSLLFGINYFAILHKINFYHRLKDFFCRTENSILCYNNVQEREYKAVIFALMGTFVGNVTVELFASYLTPTLKCLL